MTEHSEGGTAMTLITMEEAANTLGVSLRTIRRWIASGQITAYRMGPRLIRVDAAQLFDEIKRQIVTASLESQGKAE